VRVVGDEESAIVDALNALRHRCTCVFTTGGIAPTHGDITADCVAKAFGVPIDTDPRALAILHEWVKTTGADMNEHLIEHRLHDRGHARHQHRFREDTKTDLELRRPQKLALAKRAVEDIWSECGQHNRIEPEPRPLTAKTVRVP
jgi:hypothetical protein